MFFQTRQKDKKKKNYFVNWDNILINYYKYEYELYNMYQRKLQNILD